MKVFHYYCNLKAEKIKCLIKQSLWKVKSIQLSLCQSIEMRTNCLMGFLDMMSHGGRSKINALSCAVQTSNCQVKSAAMLCQLMRSQVVCGRQELIQVVRGTGRRRMVGDTFFHAPVSLKKNIYSHL